MTTQRVDFYLLNQHVPDGKLLFACRLSKKALAQGMTAFIQAGDDKQASKLDDMLWTFDQGSFVPHRMDRDEGDPAPVVIGTEAPGGNPPDVLIALAGDAPGNLRGFSRIAEVVDATDQDKQSARQRYKLYKEQGCELNTHPIDP